MTPAKSNPTARREPGKVELSASNGNARSGSGRTRRLGRQVQADLVEDDADLVTVNPHALAPVDLALRWKRR